MMKQSYRSSSIDPKVGLQSMVNNFDEPPLVLVSFEGEKFPVDEMSAMESGSLRLYIKYKEFGRVPVELSSDVLAKTVYFIKKHVEIKTTYENYIDKLKDFDSQFLEENHSFLVDLVEAAYCLRIQSLLELTSKAVVDMITGKTREEIRGILKLKNDLTFQEMSDVFKHEAWAFVHNM